MSYSTARKPWYKKWWGAILAILIWPFFLIWLIWVKSNKSKAIKLASTTGVVVLAIIVFAAVLRTLPSTANNNEQPVSLNSLTAKAASILAAATNRTEQQMTTGQTDAAQSNPLSSGSAFEKWRPSVQKDNDSNTTNAYNQAVAVYTSAKQPVPSELASWKKDNFAAYADIGVWQLAEVTNLISPSASDQSVTTSDYNAYKSDIAKAVADIKKLSPSTTVAQSTQTNAAPTQTPTASIASLNAQAVPILTPVLTNYEQLMAQGQSYAKLANVSSASSSFHNWYNQVTISQNVSDSKEVITAFNKADNLYYDAHQTAPAALNNWGNSDAGNVFNDIDNWANDEWSVLVDQATNSPTTADQQKVNTDLQSYQSDLTKAKADISQL